MPPLICQAIGAASVSQRQSTRTETVTLDGTEVRFTSSGAGPPLVLLQTPHRYARALLQALPGADAGEVIALDVPGFYHPMRGRAVTHIDQFLSLIGEFQRSRGHTRLSLLGKCAGALTALGYAARYPHRVDKVVAVAPPLSLYTMRLGKLCRWLVLQAERSLPLRRVLTASLGHPQVARVLRRVAVDGNYARLVSEELARDCMNPDVFFGVISSLLKLDIYGLLTHVQANTCILYGNRDPAVDLESVRKAQRLLPKSTAVCIDGANHGLLDCRPNQVNQVVIPFLFGQLAANGAQKEDHGRP